MKGSRSIRRGDVLGKCGHRPFFDLFLVWQFAFLGDIAGDLGVVGPVIPYAG